MDNNSTPTQEKGALTQPTEQEIQEFVNTVYYQAGQLLFEENFTPQNAVEKLVKKGLSDDVIIEIVHAFKDIIIEFINKRYVNHN